MKPKYLNYVKATGFEIGLIVNFMRPKAEIKRFLNRHSNTSINTGPSPIYYSRM